MKFTLMNVNQRYGSDISGSILKDHHGTLESAIEEAIAIEKVNSNKIDVAVVDYVYSSSGGILPFVIRRDICRNICNESIVPENLRALKSITSIFWKHYHGQKKIILNRASNFVYEIYGEMFKKFPEIKHINQNLNIEYDDDNDANIYFSINAYLDNGDTLDDDDFLHLEEVIDVLKTIAQFCTRMDQEIVVTKNTSFTEYQEMLGIYQ